MALLPADSDSVVDFEITREPGNTYRMRVDGDDGMAGHIAGYIDGIAAVEQAVYKILSTPRGKYEIYGDEYGVEIADLFGLPIEYVVPEIDRRIKDALLQDDRIEGAENFVFEIPKRGVLHVAFDVISIYGQINIEQDIEVA